MTELRPIVLPPLEHKFRSVTYTCSGEGLYKDGHPYDPRAERLLPPKGSKPGNTNNIETKPAGWWRAQCAFRGLNQSGSIADLQLRLRDAKKKMIPELKAAETKLNREFKKQNKIAKDDSWKRLKTAEEKAEANPQRYLSEVFPAAATGRPENLDIIIVKTEQRAALAKAADDMGLESVTVDAPLVGNIRPTPDRWIVIGRTRDAVWNQMRDIEREGRSKTDTSKRPDGGPRSYATTHDGFVIDEYNVVRQASPLPRRTLQVASKSAPRPITPGSLVAQTETQSARPILPLSRVARKSAPSINSRGNSAAGSDSDNIRPTIQEPRKKQTARKRASNHSPFSNLSGGNYEDEGDAGQPATKKARTSAGGSQAVSNNTKSAVTWDVRGSYVIECPNIEDEWGEKDQELTLDIYVENKNGRQQMFAMFHFIVVEGIMRFEKPMPAPKSQNGNGKRKREDSYIDEDGDVLMSDIPQYGVNNKNSRESAFHLGPNDKPSARNPTWNYRWRGEETGEGEIQLGSDNRLESITFDDKDKSLTGTFTCDFAGKCDFTGLKVMYRPHDSRIDPDMQWENRSKAAYDRASRARWG